MRITLALTYLSRAASIAAIPLFVGAGAIAQDAPERAQRFYASASIGAAFPDEFTAESGAEFDVDTDLFYTISFGGQFPARFLDLIEPRLEFEISYVDTEASSFTLNGVTDDLDGATVRTGFFQANLLHDFVWKKDQRIVPYAGGGFGAAVIGSLLDDGDTQGAFTTNAQVGLSWQFAPRWRVFTQARYFRIFNVDDGDLSTDIDGFAASVGLRVNFAAPRN